MDEYRAPRTLASVPGAKLVVDGIDRRGAVKRTLINNRYPAFVRLTGSETVKTAIRVAAGLVRITACLAVAGIIAMPMVWTVTAPTFALA